MCFFVYLARLPINLFRFPSPDPELLGPWGCPYICTILKPVWDSDSKIFPTVAAESFVFPFMDIPINFHSWRRVLQSMLPLCHTNQSGHCSAHPGLPTTRNAPPPKAIVLHNFTHMTFPEICRIISCGPSTRCFWGTYICSIAVILFFLGVELARTGEDENWWEFP